MRTWLTLTLTLSLGGTAAAQDREEAHRTWTIALPEGASGVLCGRVAGNQGLTSVAERRGAHWVYGTSAAPLPAVPAASMELTLTGPDDGVGGELSVRLPGASGSLPGFEGVPADTLTVVAVPCGGGSSPPRTRRRA